VDNVLRVAFFPDSFLEVDGVAMTSNRLVDFAKQRSYPLICIHAGPQTEARDEGSVRYLSLKRSPLAIPMDETLKYDPLFQRHVTRVRKELEAFKPDVIHITGLNDVSIIGAYLAWKLGIAMTASWHTNLHEFAAQRLRKMFRFLPESAREGIAGFAQKHILRGALLYYKMPQRILAPNQELMDVLVKGTGRKANIMVRGVDTELFSPSNRTVDDGILRFGYVGRLRAEKNVRLLAELEKRLLESGRSGFKFLIVGEGNEREYLEQNMKTAEFTGFLQGKALSEAYANMDVFIFPSETDAYGNVPQEAMASGAPAIVSDQGGPKFFVTNGQNGFVASGIDDFARYSIELIDNPDKLAEMKKASVAFAATRSWDSVFETVYKTYAEAKTHLAEAKLRSSQNKQADFSDAAAAAEAKVGSDQ
jgi:glycosyltransferase involved in cell wall biosynthesis